MEGVEGNVNIIEKKINNSPLDLPSQKNKNFLRPPAVGLTMHTESTSLAAAERRLREIQAGASTSLDQAVTEETTRIETETKIQENQEGLERETRSLLTPYESFFSQKATELHHHGQPKRTSLLARYKVTEDTVNDKGEEEYNFELRYRPDPDKQQFIPDTYTQSLRQGSELTGTSLDKAIPRLTIKFNNGEVSLITISYTKYFSLEDSHDFEGTNIPDLPTESFLNKLDPPHYAYRKQTHYDKSAKERVELTFDLQNNTIMCKNSNSFINRSSTNERTKKYTYNPESNAFEYTSEVYTDGRYENRTETISAEQYLSGLQETLQFIPTKQIQI